MKAYTKEDMKNFNRDDHGNLICPTGDYSQIHSFNECCSFGACCAFGDKCSFDEGCSFGEQCTFGDGCSFREWCTFGYCCSFGACCNFSEECTFSVGCVFHEGCSFDGGCHFGARCDGVMKMCARGVDTEDLTTLKSDQNKVLRVNVDKLWGAPEDGTAERETDETGF